MGLNIYSVTLALAEKKTKSKTKTNAKLVNWRQSSWMFPLLPAYLGINEIFCPLDNRIFGVLLVILLKSGFLGWLVSQSVSHSLCCLSVYMYSHIMAAKCSTVYKIFLNTVPHLLNGEDHGFWSHPDT